MTNQELISARKNLESKLSVLGTVSYKSYLNEKPSDEDYLDEEFDIYINSQLEHTARNEI